MLATPIPAITRKDLRTDVARVLERARQISAVMILVGMPLTLEGRRGVQARAVGDFCARLRAATDTPVQTYDERFSTVEAARGMRAAGEQPSRDRGRLDSAAAAVILQAYLDSVAIRRSRTI